ncbi:MAG: non-heme iron oxygenase ferredoxin subunit [Candidatus Promineifilaceae bacterium]
MAEFVKVAKVAEIIPGRRKLIDLEEITVALFNINGHYYCIEDVCTHDGGPLAEGILDGFAIECPRHGALFDVRDGSVISMPAVAPVPYYEVKIVGEDIYIESPDDW